MFIQITEINKPELVTINEAREIAQVSRRTIYMWMKANKINWTRTASGTVRIVKNTLFKSSDR